MLATADVVIAAVLAISALFGLMRGFVKEMAALFIWAAAGLLALAFGESVGQAIGLKLSERLLTATGFGVVFVAVLIVGAFVQRLLRGLVKTTGLSGTDRMLGLLFGTARGVLLTTLTLIVIQPFAEDQLWWSESRMIAPLLEELGPVAMELQGAVMELFTTGEPRQTDPPAEIVPPALREVI